MKNKKQRPGNTFFIGLLSFFGGISQDIFIPILPLYLANVLNLSKEFIGLAEGLVTSSASIFRFVAGILSDKFGKNKPIVFGGYFLSMISRPLLAILTTPFGVLTLRFIDGLGKGIKDTPKDSLIAGSTETGSRGKGFGIVRALDTLGSVAGPLLLFVLLFFLANNSLKYHYIFFVSAVPLVFTLIILSFFVKEVQPKNNEIKTNEKGKLSKRYYFFLAIVVFFSVGNSSDTFLILRAQNVGVMLLSIPLVYALFNFVYATASVPLGSLSDKIGREKVIILGWLAYSISYLGFGLAKDPLQIWVLFAFYGLYYATTEGVAKAFIADIVEQKIRGKAYGLYNSLVGITTLPASIIAGFLWDRINPSAPFLFGSLISLISVFLLILYIKIVKRND